ncbi:MAG TPA: hypothetical protein VHC22_13035 [Pirellulales bacterium]|nr:hypothetical protein [Pirellulales bacterium]
MRTRTKQRWRDEVWRNDRWSPQRDWRIYVGGLLMLVVTLLYLVTMDGPHRRTAPAAQRVSTTSAR